MTALLGKSLGPWNVDPGEIEAEWRWVWDGLVWGVPVFNGHRPFDFAGHELLTKGTSTMVAKPSDVGESSATFGTAAVTSPLPSILKGAAKSTLVVVASATSNSSLVALALHTGFSPPLQFYPFDVGDGVRVHWDGVNIIDENGVDRADGLMHVFAFVNHSATDHRMYADGVEIATSSTSKTIASGNDTISFGSMATILFFHGKIAEALIASRPWTAAEVALFSADPFGWCRLRERGREAPRIRRQASRPGLRIEVKAGHKVRLVARQTRGIKPVRTVPEGTSVAGELIP